MPRKTAISRIRNASVAVETVAFRTRPSPDNTSHLAAPCRSKVQACLTRACSGRSWLLPKQTMKSACGRAAVCETVWEGRSTSRLCWGKSVKRNRFWQAMTAATGHSLFASRRFTSETLCPRQKWSFSRRRNSSVTKWFSACEGMTQYNGSDSDALAPGSGGQSHLGANP